jgi:N-acetylmuramoyl-L-alanine amidase
MDFAFIHGRFSRVLCLIIGLAAVSTGAHDHRALAGPSEDRSERGSAALSKSESARLSADPALRSVTKVRLGTHEGFRRIVFELAGPHEWSLDQPAAGPIRILIPGAGLDDGVRRLDFPRGWVRSIQPMRRSGGVEILVFCEPKRVRVRTLTLTDPHRLVVDVMLPGPGDGQQTVVQGTLASPTRSDPTAATAAAKPRLPAPPPSAGEAPSPPPAERSPRPTATPSAPQREPVGAGAASAPSGADREEAAPLTVVLDPGHGGHDTGAIGPSGLMEKDVVLDLALRVRRLLQQRLGVRVLMTRTDDVFVPLPERSAFANRVKADFLVSLHVNAANKRGAVGFETFYFTREPSDNDARASTQRENLVIENNGTTGKDLESLLKTTLADMAVTRDMKESSNLAERILSALEKILRVENRGVKSGPFYVLATAAMPAVLVESAFITNPREERKLQREDYREQIARALFDGIAAYKLRYEQRLGLQSAPTGVGS